MTDVKNIVISYGRIEKAGLIIMGIGRKIQNLKKRQI